MADSSRQVLLNAVTTGQSTPVLMGDVRAWVMYFQSNGVTSGGMLTIEEADYDDQAGPPYAGTWSKIVDVDPSKFSGGAQLAVHSQYTAYGFVRVRVSTPIAGGGTVTVTVAAVLT